LVNVDGFTGLEWIGRQQNYTLDIAKKLLGYYIFPAEGYSSPPNLISGTEKRDTVVIKEGFISWILKHDEDMETLLDGFDEKQFEKLNRDALNELLNMTINEYMNEIADTPTPAENILVSAEGEPLERFTKYIDELESRGKKGKFVGVDLPDMKASEFLETLSKKVLDPEFFNIDIKLKDILNQTEQSKYFYQLTPTQMKDPVFQRLFAELTEEDYRVADVDIPGKQPIGVDNPGEFLQRYETVMRRNRPVDVTVIENGEKRVFETMAGEIFDFQNEETMKEIMDKLLPGYGSGTFEVRQYDYLKDETGKPETYTKELTPLEMDTKIAIHIAAPIMYSRHSDETVIDMDFLYPYSLLPGYDRIERVLNEFKKNANKIEKLTKSSEKTGEGGKKITVPAEIILSEEITIDEIKDSFDFNVDFKNEDDQDKYEQAIVITQDIILNLEERNIKHNLVNSTRVDKVISKFLKELVAKVTGQIYTVEFTTKSGTELDASREDLGIRILAGDNPISLNRLKDVMKNEPVMKITGTNVSDNDVKAFTTATPRIVETKLTRRTPISFKVGPLDLSKGSALPDAAKSSVQVINAGVSENKISQLITIKKDLKDYSRKKVEEGKELTPDETVYNMANAAMITYDDIFGKLKTMSLIESKDVGKVISRTNINKLIDLLANIIENYDSVQGKKVDNMGMSTLIDDIDKDLDNDKLPFVDFRQRLGQLKEISEVVTATLEPTPEFGEERKNLTEEEVKEQDEEREKLRREMAQEDDDEDSLEVATTQGAEGETVEEEETDIKELSELNKNDYEFIMNELKTTDDYSLLSIIDAIDDPDIEAQIDSYDMMLEEIRDVKNISEDTLSREGQLLSASLNGLLGSSGTLDNLRDNQKIFKQIRKDMRGLEKANENITSSSGRLSSLLKTYDLAEIVLESIAEKSQFNTVNIVDLVVKYDLVFVEDLENGPMFNTLRGKINFEYKIIKVMETTSGKYDFPTVDAVGRKGSAKRMVNIADRARPRGSIKGQIQDERKAKIYNQIYDNLLELENILRRVEAE